MWIALSAAALTPWAFTATGSVLRAAQVGATALLAGLVLVIALAVAAAFGVPIGANWVWPCLALSLSGMGLLVLAEARTRSVRRDPGG
jgi:hypothetical protein